MQTYVQISQDIPTYKPHIHPTEMQIPNAYKTYGIYCLLYIGCIHYLPPQLFTTTLAMSFLAIAVFRNMPWPYCSSSHLIAQGWKLQLLDQTKIVFFSCLLARLQKSLAKNVNLSLLTVLPTVFSQPAYIKDLILEWLIHDKNRLLVIPLDLAPVLPISVDYTKLAVNF